MSVPTPQVVWLTSKVFALRLFDHFHSSPNNPLIPLYVNSLGPLKFSPKRLGGKKTDSQFGRVIHRPFACCLSTQAQSFHSVFLLPIFAWRRKGGRKKESSARRLGVRGRRIDLGDISGVERPGAKWPKSKSGDQKTVYTACPNGWRTLLCCCCEVGAN